MPTSRPNMPTTVIWDVEWYNLNGVGVNKCKHTEKTRFVRFGTTCGTGRWEAMGKFSLKLISWGEYVSVGDLWLPCWRSGFPLSGKLAAVEGVWRLAKELRSCNGLSHIKTPPHLRPWLRGHCPRRSLVPPKSEGICYPQAQCSSTSEGGQVG